MTDDLKTGNQFEGKEDFIKDAFTEIAEYYDDMNEVMSMHMVQGWHKFMMKQAGDIRGKTCLDVGTGTGEIAFHIARTAGPGSTVIGVDLTPAMLELAKKKEAELDLPVKIDWREGDALALDIPDGSMNLVTSGYMLRNVTDILQAVSEMHRVLAPGGRVVVAELSKPKNGLVKIGYNLYMKRVKRYGKKRDNGKKIDGKFSPYEWLTTSIEGFPYGDDMVKIFKKAGFQDAHYFVKSMGAVNIYVGTKE
jgi:demethylmenaquinone methyltransferase/2-methoxy-6-polyprenyl-1,4-benzoquinol methylase